MRMTTLPSKAKELDDLWKQYQAQIRPDMSKEELAALMEEMKKRQDEIVNRGVIE